MNKFIHDDVQSYTDVYKPELASGNMDKSKAAFYNIWPTNYFYSYLLIAEQNKKNRSPPDNPETTTYKPELASGVVEENEAAFYNVGLKMLNSAGASDATV